MEPKTYLYNGPYGNHRLVLQRRKYVHGGSLAVEALEKDYGCWVPYGSLTVFLEGQKLADDEAFLDVNNFPDVERFVALYGLAKPTGRLGFSGFCVYPLYKFNLDILD